MTRILLAYSAGLHAADPIPSLAHQYNAEIVTLTLDFGQGRELEAFRDRALAAGASRAHVLDVAAAFATGFVLPALRADALYADGRPRTTALGRMIVAQKLVEVAAIEQTTMVAHGCGPADPRLAAAVAALDPRLTVIDVNGARPAALHAYAPHTSDAPGEAAHVDVAFTHGAPTAVNEIAMPLVDLIASLDMLAGPHRVGRYDRLETPGVAVVDAAHRALQQRLAPDDPARQALRRRYREIVDTGAWFSPEREGLDHTIAEVEQPVSGAVRVRLLNGKADVVDIVTEGARG